MVSMTRQDRSVDVAELDRLPALLGELRRDGGRIAIRHGEEVIAVVVPPALLAQFDRLTSRFDDAFERIGAAFADTDPDEIDREARDAVREVRAARREPQHPGS